MADSATSDHPAVREQLDRLAHLSPGADVLGLDRIAALLARLGNPERALPPVFHVAGTNGKGSTCAFLRAAIEAAGLSAHVYTSPHLVRFNERIRVAGTLIGDDALAALLGEVLDDAAGMEISFFEATTAAAFLTFARTPADACVIEVGLGGRLDATNVIPAPAICGIAQLGRDHEQFLGDKLTAIAAEKAGIAKPGVPIVTELYAPPIAARIGEAAAAVGAPWLPRGGRWNATIQSDHLLYEDEGGLLDLPLPGLPGAHQAMNAALAAAMLRHQPIMPIPTAALKLAITRAEWPARLQQLAKGPLRDLLPAGSELWLDGAHNPNAVRAIADFFNDRPAPLHVVIGLLANKDAIGVIEAVPRAASLLAVPIEGHAHHAPDALAGIAAEAGIDAAACPSVAKALETIARHADPSRRSEVLIMGSLYLAGAVLRENGQSPA